MSDNTNNSTNSGTENADQPPRRGFEALKHHVIVHKVNVALWATRVFTLVFAFFYFIPIFGNPYNAYYKVLVANAATSALRLHQRLPRVQFTRDFLSTLLGEDSCHYLFYSLIFLHVSPVTLAIVPVALFALLHSASYSLTLLDTLGQNSWWGARLLISLVEFQSRNILRAVSFVEIILMPLTVILVLMGRAGLLTPFIYYHFVMQRYTSRRNPYTRNMFRELRSVLVTTAEKPSMPGIVKTILLGVVSFTLRLAPPQYAETQQ